MTEQQTRPASPPRKVRIDGIEIEIDGVTCRCGAGCRVPLNGAEDHVDWPHTFWHVADDGYLERPHRHHPETGRRIPGPFPKYVLPPEEAIR